MKFVIKTFTLPLRESRQGLLTLSAGYYCSLGFHDYEFKINTNYGSSAIGLPCMKRSFHWYKGPLDARSGQHPGLLAFGEQKVVHFLRLKARPLARPGLLGEKSGDAGSQGGGQVVTSRAAA